MKLNKISFRIISLFIISAKIWMAPLAWSAPPLTGAPAAVAPAAATGISNAISGAVPSAPPAVQNAAPLAPVRTQKVDVNALKKQYWLEAPDMNLGVVQHRVYTKAWKFSFEMLGGSFSADPFVTSWLYGAQLGYNFGEYFGVHAMYWKFSTGFNSAYNTLVAATSVSSPPGYGSNSNQMTSLMGGEMNWSFLYGKLSLVGKAIIHFDLFFLGGVGILSASTGATQGEMNFSTMAFWPGIGQQIYFTTWLALRADYRFMIFSEKVVERNTPAAMGTVLETKSSGAPVFTLGLSFLFL